MAADAVIAKLVAKTALALMVSQVFNDPTHIKTEFGFSDKETEQAVKLLNGGCKYLWDYGIEKRKEALAKAKEKNPDAEQEEEIDPEHRINSMADRDDRFVPHRDAFMAFCRNQPMNDKTINLLKDSILYYNEAMKNIEEDKKKVVAMKSLKLPQSSVAVDSSNKKIGDVYQQGNRRVFVPLSEVPPMVRWAFLAAEDKNFYGTPKSKAHNGVDEDGVLRAAKAAQKEGQHPVGGSTITQQLIKNLVVGDSIEESRKIREMYLATMLEQGPTPILTKDQILELYINYNYFGAASMGLKMAAETYFGKDPKDLTVVEAAYLAALQKCPKSCGPSKPENLKARTTYVLDRMVEFVTPTGALAISQKDHDDGVASIEKMKFKTLDPTKSYVVDKLGEAVKAQFNIDPYERPSRIHTTINGPLQYDMESIAQEGAARYQITWKNAKFSGPEKNLEDEMKAMVAQDPTYAIEHKKELWRDALRKTQMPLYDIRFDRAIVLTNNGKGVVVGLIDGRMMNLRPWTGGTLPLKELKEKDVIYIFTHEATAKEAAYAELRFRPTVQVAALAMKNNGEIVGMVGGVSRAMNNDEFNRAVDAKRSPGSTIKPIYYLKALQAGIRPNEMVRNGKFSQDEMEWLGTDWNPDNYEGSSDGPSSVTLRFGLEESFNQVTVRLWPTIAAKTGQDPQVVLTNLFDAVRDVGITSTSPRFVPDLIGTFDVTMLNMATFYSTIANLGCRPSPRYIESIDVDGQNYPYQIPEQALNLAPSNITCADRSMTPTPASVADGVSFFQLRTLLQGVPVNGTAAGVGQRVSDLIPKGAGNIGDYVGIKTGTSNGWRDSWMIGFTSDITIAVWVGFDGAKQVNKDPKAKKPKPPTLGYDAQGAKVAGPIFEGIFRVAAKYYPLKPLSGPPTEIAQLIYRVSDGQIVDYLRRDPSMPQQDQQIAQPNPEMIDPQNDPSQNYVYRQRRPRRDGGPPDSDTADYGYMDRGQPVQQPYVPNRTQRVPQTPDFFGGLFKNGWGQAPDDDEQYVPQHLQQPQRQQRRQQQPSQPQGQPGFFWNR